MNKVEPDHATWTMIVLGSIILVLWLGLVVNDNPAPTPNPTTSTTIFTVTTTTPPGVVVCQNAQGFKYKTGPVEAGRLKGDNC